MGPFPLCADICSSPVLLSLSSSPLYFVIAFCFTGLLHPSPSSFPSTSPLQGFSGQHRRQRRDSHCSAFITQFSSFLYVESVFFDISGHLRLLFEKGKKKKKGMRISFFFPLLLVLQISWGTQSLTSVDSHTLAGAAGKSTLE